MTEASAVDLVCTILMTFCIITATGDSRGGCSQLFLQILLYALFGASLSEPRIHEVQEAVLYVYIYVYIYICMYVCGVIISVRRELNFERVR